MTCKGICERAKALKPANGSVGRRYSAGQKRCAVCEIFIVWNGVRCLRCGSRLRTKPKTRIDRRRTVMICHMLLLRVSAADSTFSLAVHLAFRSFAQHDHIDLIISSISRDLVFA